MFTRIGLWFSLSLAVVLLTAGASKPKATFRIHLQVSGEGLSIKQAMPVLLPSTGERIFVQTIPELSERDLEVVESRATNVGIGLYLKFNAHGTLVLNTLTTDNQGQQLVFFINNQVFYAPVIDTRVTTGEMFIPKQAPPEIVLDLQQVVKQGR